MKPLPQVVSDHVDFLTEDFFEFDIELPDAASDAGEERQLGLVHALELAPEVGLVGLARAEQAPDVEEHGGGPVDFAAGDGPSIGIGAEIVIPELFRLLHEKDERVLLAAVNTLGSFAHLAAEAAPQLQQLEKHELETVQKAAAKARQAVLGKGSGK